MTITVDHRSRRGNRLAAGSLTRLLSLGYGVAVYEIFLATLVYAVGFVSGVVVPKSIDTGTIWPPSVALGIDLQLLGLFAVQHSGMARRGVKRVLTGHVPPLVERSTYVLCSSLVLILLFAAWQPLPAVVLFAGAMTAYIFVGIWLEERDRAAFFGDQYRQYRERVAMLLPGIF